MAILRINKKTNYTTIDNKIFKNKDMSLKAKGLLCEMLSLSDKWEFSEKGLAQLSNDSRDGIRTALKELEKLGYVKRKRLRNDKGQLLNTEYHVYEKPMLGKPTLENPMLEIQHNKITKNKITNNKLTSNKKDIVEIIEYLNEKTGSKFNPNAKGHSKFINARIEEGYKKEDFIKVIDTMTDKWGKDKKMKEYLRPSTLFNSEKFDNYLNINIKTEKVDTKKLNYKEL